MDLKEVFKLVVAVSLFLFFLLAVEGRRSESCQCYFTGACMWQGEIPVKYYACKGSCAAYSHYETYWKCARLNLTSSK